MANDDYIRYRHILRDCTTAIRLWRVSFIHSKCLIVFMGIWSSGHHCDCTRRFDYFLRHWSMGWYTVPAEWLPSNRTRFLSYTPIGNLIRFMGRSTRGVVALLPT